MTQKQTIDAMQMVREIRDRINEQTSQMTPDERMAYIRRNGEEANRRFRQAGESTPSRDAASKG
jgi:hypothetical protein